MPALSSHFFKAIFAPIAFNYSFPDFVWFAEIPRGLVLASPGSSLSELILGGPPAMSGLEVSTAALVCVFHTFLFSHHSLGREIAPLASF